MTIQASFESTRSLMFTMSPTEIRKNGMNSASPTKRSRIMSRLCSGISMFSVRPARNAPIIGSRPARGAVAEQMYAKAKTNRKPDTLSAGTLRKNHLPSLGTLHTTSAT